MLYHEIPVRLVDHNFGKVGVFQVAPDVGVVRPPCCANPPDAQAACDESQQHYPVNSGLWWLFTTQKHLCNNHQQQNAKHYREQDSVEKKPDLDRAVLLFHSPAQRS